jgi:hypothetical protein
VTQRRDAKRKFDPSAGPPGDGLIFSRDGAAAVLSARRGTLGPYRTIVQFVLTASLAAVPVALAREHALPLAMAVWIGPLWLIAIAIVVLTRQAREELRVSKSEVSTRLLMPWGPTAVKSVPARAVKGVAVQSPPGYGDQTLVCVVTDESTLTFGLGLSEAEKEWARDCIIFVMAR